jgi:hypothetical protein
MMCVTLETLELAPGELEVCREAIRKLAFCKWLDAGCPSEGEVEFWLQAESEWIATQYVPSRDLDGSRPAEERHVEALIPSAARPRAGSKAQRP